MRKMRMMEAEMKKEDALDQMKRLLLRFRVEMSNHNHNKICSFVDLGAEGLRGVYAAKANQPPISDTPLVHFPSFFLQEKNATVNATKTEKNPILMHCNS